jgi:hypothetical protein
VIEFDLQGLHPSYDRVVRDVIRGLDVDYPLEAVQRVELYRGQQEGDESLGCVRTRGVISLNSRWFSKPIDELRDAARVDDLVPIGGSAPPLQWHGGMEEPLHLLSHEFGHCLADKIPKWRDFAEKHWEHSCCDPIHARPPSGYCLATPDEFWADCFAAMRLNYQYSVVGMMRKFLEEHAAAR